MGGGGWRYPSPSRPAPVPTQERALDTVRAAIEATIQLLDRAPETHVTLEAIRLRSGVSQGSLTHHFGSRSGLIAAAHVERHLRACAADESFVRRLDGAFSEPEAAAATVLSMVDAMVSPDRRVDRWVRLSAIAAAYGDDELTATLSRNYTALTDTLSDLLAQGRANGVLDPEVDLRSVALLIAGQGQGLVLDDVSGVETDVATWNRVLVVLGSTFLGPEASALLVAGASERFGDLWRADLIATAPQEERGAADLAGLRRRAGIDDSTKLDEASVGALIDVALRPGPVPDRNRVTASDATRQAFLGEAITALRSRGQRDVDVATLRRATGVSPQRFHRMFGDRDGLIREARLMLEVRRTVRATTGLAGILTASATPADVRRALIAGAVQLSERNGVGAMWQRIETIAATRTDPQLQEALGRVQRVARGLVVEQIRLAQRRGLIDPMLPPSGLARLIEGSMFWHVLHGLDERRPNRSDWTRLLLRVTEVISPDR